MTAFFLVISGRGDMISLLINRKDGTMKFITLLLILAAIAYGVKYAYDNGMLESVNNTVERTGVLPPTKRLSLQITPGSGESYLISAKETRSESSFYAKKTLCFYGRVFSLIKNH